jgi:hypothetical protein
VDFDYMSRKEIIRRPVKAAVGEDIADIAPGEEVEYEEQWTGDYIFENE